MAMPVEGTPSMAGYLMHTLSSHVKRSVARRAVQATPIRRQPPAQPARTAVTTVTTAQKPTIISMGSDGRVVAKPVVRSCSTAGSRYPSKSRVTTPSMPRPSRASSSLVSRAGLCMPTTAQKHIDVQEAKQPTPTPVARASVATMTSNVQNGIQRLASGVRVQVGDFSFLVNAPLGSGSFGVVWAATCDDISTEHGVAIKEIRCHSKRELEATEREAAFLRRLGKDTRGLPNLLAQDFLETGVSKWRVRLAMSTVPGIPLSRFFDKEMALGDGPWQDVCERINFARELFLQMSTCLEYVESKGMFHRDAHARNMHVHEMDGRLVFGLVDFGLAVDATAWQGGSWRLENVSGDCRYWTTSAWMMLTVGVDCLLQDSNMPLEYKSWLDCQSFALTVLQSLVGAHTKGCFGANEPSINQAWLSLHHAWTDYWTTVTQYQQRIFEAVTERTATAFDTLRKELRTKQVFKIVRAHLVVLRDKIAGLRDECARVPSPTSLGNLLAALYTLVSDGTNCGSQAPWTMVRAWCAQAATGDAPKPDEEEEDGEAPLSPVSYILRASWSGDLKGMLDVDKDTRCSLASTNVGTSPHKSSGFTRMASGSSESCVETSFSSTFGAPSAPPTPEAKRCFQPLAPLLAA